MPLYTSYINEESRLDLSFDGNLDLTVSHDVCEVCRRARPGLSTCIIDLSDVKRVFDSGVALLQMLHRHFDNIGTSVVLFSDRPEILEQIPVFPPQTEESSARITL